MPPTRLAGVLMVIAGLLGSGCAGKAAPAPATPTPVARPDGAAVVLAYGHSYIAGVPGQPPPWPTVLAAQLGMPLVSVAHGGDLASQCAARMAASADHSADRDVVVWECDLNDARRYGTDARHLARFREAFVAALSRMRSGRVIVVEDPPIKAWGLYAPFNHGSVAALDAYNAVIERAAPPEVRVVKILGWDPTTMLATDGVHPNEAGKRAIAATVAAAAASGS